MDRPRRGRQKNGPTEIALSYCEANEDPPDFTKHKIDNVIGR